MSESEEPKGSDSTSQPGIQRRQWLTGFAAGGVVATTATLGYDSCQVQRRRAADSPALELNYIRASIEPLREVDYVAEGKRQGLLSGDIKEALAADINQYLATTYQALVYSELVTALPEDLRTSEEVESDIAVMSPVLDQAVADAYYVVGMADDETKAQIDQEIRDDPDALMDMASLLDKDGARHGMGLRGRLRLRRASRQLSSRLRVQSADAVLTELTEQITRVAERNGTRSPSDTDFQVTMATRRMWAHYDDPFASTPLPPQPSETESSDALEEPDEDSLDVDRERRGRLARLERKEKSLTRASRGLAGAGGGLVLAGGIAYAATASVGALVPICLGGFLLLVALFVLAARTRRRRQLKDERARSKSPGDQ